MEDVCTKPHPSRGRKSQIRTQGALPQCSCHVPSKGFKRRRRGCIIGDSRVNLLSVIYRMPTDEIRSPLLTKQAKDDRLGNKRDSLVSSGPSKGGGITLSMK